MIKHIPSVPSANTINAHASYMYELAEKIVNGDDVQANTIKYIHAKKEVERLISNLNYCVKMGIENYKGLVGLDYDSSVVL